MDLIRIHPAQLFVKLQRAQLAKTQPLFVKQK